MSFLSGLQNESVVFSQRERVSGEFIQFRSAETNRRLHLAPPPLLEQNVSDVIGAKGACRVGLLNRAGDRFRTVVANEFNRPEQ